MTITIQNMSSQLQPLSSSTPTQTKIVGGGMDDFQSPSHFHQFMQQVQMGAHPSAELYMKRGCSYTISSSGGGGAGGNDTNEVHIHRPDLKGNLREKLSLLRHTRMSRQTAVNRLKKKAQGVEDDNEDILKILDLYQSLTKNGFNVLHPDEAVSNLDKYEPVVEQLTRTYDSTHPLTAYYRMLTGLVRVGKAMKAEKAEKAEKAGKAMKAEKAGKVGKETKESKE